MSYKKSNKNSEKLPQVFQRLGSFRSKENSYKLPDYTAISRMDNHILHYPSPPAKTALQQQQGQGQGQGNSLPPGQNFFNFVKEQQQQQQQQSKAPISFVNKNSTTNSNRGISFMNSFHQQQPMQFQPSNNMGTQQWNNKTQDNKDIAKKIKIVASLPVESDSDSDASSTASKETDDITPTRKVIISSSNRSRNTSRERPPAIKSTSSSLKNKRRSRRPRRKSTDNHNDSDEDLAPFLKGRADSYIPRYYSDNSTESDSDSSEDAITTTTSERKNTYSRTVVLTKPEHKTSAASILASGPLPPSKKFTAPLVPTLPPSKKFTAVEPTLSPSKKFTTVEQTLPPSKKFATAAEPPLPPSRKFTAVEPPLAPSTKFSAPTPKTTHAKKPAVPISHKIITASNTIVPPKPTSTVTKRATADKTMDQNMHILHNNDNTLSQKCNDVNSSLTADIAKSTSAATVKKGTITSVAAVKNGAIATSASAVKTGTNIISSDGKLVNIHSLRSDNVEIAKSNDNLPPQTKHLNTKQVTRDKNVEELDSKHLLRQLDIDDRDDVVMDIAPPVILNNCNTTLKQEPVEEKLHIPNFDQLEKPLTEPISQVFQQAAWDTVAQPVAKITANEVHDDIGSISASSTTTNSTHENDMDFEYTKSRSSSPTDSMIANHTNTITAATTAAAAAIENPFTPSDPVVIKQTTPSKRKRSRIVRAPWKVRMAADGEISYLNTVTGEISIERPVSP